MSGRARASRHLIALMVVAATAAACGDSPTAPPPVGPVVMCPADETVPSSSGTPIPVIFPQVTSAGGTAPVSIICSPQSGSVFPLGTSKVTCTATDAARLSSSCSFAVTVQGPPHLAATRFVAFGDSITQGKLSDGTLLTSESYPAILESALRARYSAQAQSISVTNAGCAGEKTATADALCGGGGVVRLPGVLAAFNPQALLLLEGANDLASGDSAAITPMVDALRSMVRDAKNRGVMVFLCTLTPVRQNGIPPRGNGGFFLTPPANDQIKLLAASEGVNLIDLFAGFGNSPDPFIGIDGLHPTLAGYQKLADLDFSAIQSKLEGTSAFVP